ncbi:MAG: hypothetical protein HKN40_00400 [Winogradskyella sp.]|jgi:hypothetical protein|uniref:hypothetical protein n=1 Tax=Winogradskyella sp. TaxID=1883156 RepID=UPI001823AC91|nr:hypothetical protein [Winogradskyella sp.]
MNAKKYLLDIGFDDAHLSDLFNDDDKSYYTIPELMEGYLELKLLDFARIYFEILDTQSVPPADSVIVNEYLKLHKND